MKKFIIFYVLLLVSHFIHIIEEALGRAPFIEAIYGGLVNFLIIGAVLFVVPLVLLYLTINKNKIAYNLSFIYAGIMTIDGIAHLTSFSLNKDYLLTSIAGAYSGIGLVLFGVLLFYYLLKGK